MTATFCQTSNILSDADLFQLGGQTNVLCATNGIDNRTQQGSRSFIYKNSKTDLLHQRLVEFNNLLVRHLEVVAVRSVGKNGNLVQILTNPDHDDGTSDNSSDLNEEGDKDKGHVYYTENPDSETDKKCIEIRGAPRLVGIIAEPTDPMDSAGAWFLKHTIGTTKWNVLKMSITIAKHISMLVSLIKASHDASSDDGLQTTKVRLHNYVILANIAKIHERLLRGTDQHDRNLWEFLTKQSTDLPTAPGKDIPFEPSTAKGMKILGELLKKMLSILKKKSKTGLAPELEPWLERPNKINYTIDTRPVFQTLLSNLLIAVNTAVLELLNKKHKCLMEKGRDN